MGLLKMANNMHQFLCFFYKINRSATVAYTSKRKYNNKNKRLKAQTQICLIVLMFSLFAFGVDKAAAEGTKTWQPDSSVPANLYVTSPTSNSSGVRSFAGYLSQPNMKMYVHIEDPSNEMLYLGFSRGNNRGVASGYAFRIVSPTGAVVHGPYTVNSPNISNYTMAAAGPDVLVSGGYSTSNAMFTFDPQGLPSGDYSIEFGNNVSMYWFDVTVATKGASPQAIEGRLWSQAWQVDNGSFNNALKAMFYARDEKGYVTQVNFAEAGIRPYVGQFSFNDTGTGDTGNTAEDRKSVPNAQSGNPEQQVFLNQPDPNVYPLGLDGEIQNLPLKVADPANPIITIEVTQAGRVEIVLDFGTIGDYSEAIDRRLFAMLTAGVNSIPWDGKRGDGQIVQPQDYPIPVTISYTQGETHFTAYDVEYLDQSFVVRTQTTAGLTSPNVLFWDDSRISQSPNLSPNKKVETDVGSIARQPWSNFNYGNVNTINTWWFAYRDYVNATVLMPGDYGDAPIAYGGAVHKILDIPITYLGTIAPDKEPQAATPLDGAGDDADGSDDEDALSSLPKLHTESTEYQLNIPCFGAGTVAAWIDFDQNETFDDNERQAAACDASGSVSLVWGSLSGLSTGTTYIRLRIASDANQVAKAVGGASDGEVEDYALSIEMPDYDYGDAPDDGVDFKYGTAKHLLPANPDLFMGAKKPTKDEASDYENWKSEWQIDGKHKNWFKNNKVKRAKGNGNKKKNEAVDPAPNVVGDGEDEDGLITTALNWQNGTSCTGILPDGSSGSIAMTDTRYCITVKASNNSAIAAQLVGWIDFNQNGEFDDPSERSVVAVDADPSNDSTQGNVPAGTDAQSIVIYWDNQTKIVGEFNTFIRLRLTSDPEFKSNNSPNPIGVAINGEVEDTNIGMNVIGTDFGDAPASYGDASHIIELDAYMGTILDNDNTTQNTTNGGTDGTGDDNDGFDDDDGVSHFPSLKTHFSSYSIEVTVTSPTAMAANLVGWIDFDNNGVFDSDEAATVSVPQNTTEAIVTLQWSTIPADIQAGSSYLRLRLTTDTTIATGTANTSVATGLANDGEVEDYAITIEQGLQPFVCDGRPYTVIGAPGILQEIDRTTLAVTSLGNFDPAIQFNGIGYNALDNFIYGYARGEGSIDNLHILQGGSGRKLVDLGLPTGTGTFNPINYSGTMDNAGNFYGISSSNLFIVAIGNNPAPDSLTYTAIPRSGNTSTPADISFTIYDDALYGVQSGKLIRISTTGVGSITATTGDALPSAAGGGWSASDGSLYFYNNGGGELYKVDVSQSPAMVLKVGNVTSNGLFDGTACTPPDLKKDASVSETQAGGTFSYTYTVANAFNFPITVSFADVLPATLKYDTASFASNDGLTPSTLNDTTLNISNISLSARQTVSFSVAVRVDRAINTEQDIDNQATINYGSITLNSDDPDTAAINDPTRVHVLPIDYGDAPTRYGDAAHAVPTTPSLYLGSIKPDVDSQSQNTANAGVDGTGDDDDGSDDEDSVTSLAKLTDIDSSYEVTVIVNNSSGASANLVGWIDFDADGVFAADEAATLAVNTGTSNASVTLKWNTIPTDITANDKSYLRLRFTTDTTIATGTANTSQANGIASDGEVEDYLLVIEVGGFPVKGRVYNDSNVDGVNDVAKKGISGLPVVLVKIEANPANNTCVSTKTRADGNYTFFPVIPGVYQLYEASREVVTTPKNCDVTKAKDPAGYRSTTDNVLASFNVVDAAITGKDFGDVNGPLFAPNHNGSVLPNNIVFYSHTFTPKSSGTVNFTTASNTPVTSGWSSVVYQDTDCNAQLNDAEGNAPVTSNLPTVEGQIICLVNKVSAPANVNSGETYSNVISADFNFNNNVLAGITILKVTDLTKAAANDSVLGSSRLALRKTVENITQGTAETETQNQAKSGDVLRYRIYYSNSGTGVITELKINDVIPTFTTISVAPSCEMPLPVSLTSCDGAVNGSAIEWTFGNGDTLQGGAKGMVSYDVLID